MTTASLSNVVADEFKNASIYSCRREGCLVSSAADWFSIRNKQAKPAAGNEFSTDVWITEFRAARVAEAANPDR